MDIRRYEQGDYDACRGLWAELTERHRGIYGDPTALFHEFGFRTLGHVDMFMELQRRDRAWLDGPDLHGRRYTY